MCVFSIASCGSDTKPIDGFATVTDIAIHDENGGKIWVGDRLVGSFSIGGKSDITANLRWLRNETVIDGATNSAYLVSEVDAGQSLSFEVTPTEPSGDPISSATQSASIFVDYFRGTRVLAIDFESAQTNWAYPIYVYLPDGYQESTKQYPVVYTLDGFEGRFNLFADILDAKAKEVILVAIAAGAADGELKRREIDYVLPGATSYYNFLTLELIPFIDSQYRSNQSNRTLVGHSLGGLFAGLALLMEAPGARHFSSFLVQDGSFWNQPEETIAMEEDLFSRTQTLPVNLLLASSSAPGGNVLVARDFRNLLQSRDYDDLMLTFMVFNVPHGEEFASTSFRRGVDILFP